MDLMPEDWSKLEADIQDYADPIANKHPD